jgi:hypothetical protein
LIWIVERTVFGVAFPGLSSGFYHSRFLQRFQKTILFISGLTKFIFMIKNNKNKDIRQKKGEGRWNQSMHIVY